MNNIDSGFQQRQEQNGSIMNWEMNNRMEKEEEKEGMDAIVLSSSSIVTSPTTS